MSLAKIRSIPYGKEVIKINAKKTMRGFFKIND